ncbi:hypothetical protein JW851_04100 [Candidatus Woesearchaeota archaeon]|nr:hypothetical protein [Candidatus Woesearchaeota archaeon]
MIDYYKELKEEKETLNFVLEEIAREITEEHLPKLPRLSDFTETIEKYRPSVYKMNLTLSKLTDCAHGRKFYATATANITKQKSEKEYKNFKEYWNDIKKGLLDENKTHGQKAFLCIEIFRNLLEYYGNDISIINKTADALQEIAKRFIKFKRRHNPENMEIIFPDEVTIKCEYLSQAKRIYLSNLYETFFLDKKTLRKIVDHDREGKFEQNIPIEIKTNVRAWYDKK